MIVLFTDYGLQGPYLGQIEAVLYRMAPQQRVIPLFPDLPQHNPRAAAYLLAAYTRDFTANTIFFCVVDPGVGSFTDDPVMLRLDQRWFVGANNGMFDLVVRHAADVEMRRIDWRPQNLSTSFHGRDLYAPVCAMLANGDDVPASRLDWRDKHGWPDDLGEIIYIDAFGNCITGQRASGMDANNKLILAGKQVIEYADTFAAVPPGKAFWYENSSGLIEIAVNRGSAQAMLDVQLGSRFNII